MTNTRPGKLAKLAIQRGTTVKDLVIEALKEGKSQGGAAQVLGVNINTIRHHIKAYGLQVESTVSVEVHEAAEPVDESSDYVVAHA